MRESLTTRAWLFAGPIIRQLRATLCFSQEGEDLIISRLFEDRRRGFYVDVGAHHPTRFSNTYLLYLRGWRGINIDASPGAMARFQSVRPRDINLEIAIGRAPGRATLYIFNEPAVNTFDEECAAAVLSHPNYRVVDRVELPVFPLSEVLATYLPPDSTIDFLSVDVEGRDLAVLQSNDWDRFSPRIVCCEYAALTREQRESPVSFLIAQGYSIVGQTANSFVLARRS